MRPIGTLTLRAFYGGNTLEVRVFARKGALVLHEECYVAKARAEAKRTGVKALSQRLGDCDYVISHEASTFRLVDDLPRETMLRLLDRLAELDWSSIPSDVEEVIDKIRYDADHPLRLKMKTLLEEMGIKMDRTGTYVEVDR